MSVHGTCDPRFDTLKSKFTEFLSNGRDLGASICVNLHGANVVDLWGGYANTAKTKPWEENTIVNVWSSTKNVTSLAALLLIDRGLLDPEENVSTYWPEFAANGKENVKVKHFLSHTSGLSTWQEKVTFDDICDVEKTTKMLEAQKPLWEPGTASGYHSLVFGHLIGGLIQHVTKKSLGTFIADELAHPLSADFRLGCPESDWHRIADLVPPPPMNPDAPIPDGFKDASSVMFRTMMNPPLNADVASTESWRKSEIGAGNGHTNARGIVRILSPISLNGSVDGHIYLSPATVAKIFQEQSNSPDFVVPMTVRFGLGYGIAAEKGKEGSFPDWIPAGKVAAWGGWGGSGAVMDVTRGLTIAYVMNRMDNFGEDGKGDRLKEYVKLAYAGLGVDM
jgi:CubicO group peptidase (beta-lactamase class C family)